MLLHINISTNYVKLSNKKLSAVLNLTFGTYLIKC